MAFNLIRIRCAYDRYSFVLNQEKTDSLEANVSGLSLIICLNFCAKVFKMREGKTLMRKRGKGEHFGTD